jgi:signal transduction histidine kinase
MEANNFLPHFEMHNVTPIVQNAAEPFFSTAKKKNISLNITSEAGPLFVNTDRIILRDILDNLIDNAIKFTQSGTVKVSISSKKIDEYKYVVIAIEDSGIGIPQGKEGMAFQEFRQISEGLNRNYEGIGLGLTVTKRLVERINGKMYINSVEGKGTTIKIYLASEDGTN